MKVMESNIDKVLERGEKLDVIVDKADTLRFQASGLVSAHAPRRGVGGGGSARARRRAPSLSAA